MIETMDGEATTGAGDGTADVAADFHPDDVVVGECRCLACESLIPPHAVRAKLLASPGPRARGRLVHLYCCHCDLTYELVQVRSADGWSNSAMTNVTDRAAKARIVRGMADGQGVTYLDRPAADPAEVGRMVLIKRLDRIIAQHEERAAEAREQRAALIGVTPAEATALGVGRGGQFPFTSGDVRHLVDAADDDNAPWARG